MLVKLKLWDKPSPIKFKLEDHTTPKKEFVVLGKKLKEKIIDK